LLRVRTTPVNPDERGPFAHEAPPAELVDGHSPRGYGQLEVLGVSETSDHTIAYGDLGGCARLVAAPLDVPFGRFVNGLVHRGRVG
jgi:hypothetical protein